MTFPILPSNAAVTGFPLRSLRFNSADSAYLNRTPASATNQKTWTWSGWVKLSEITSSSRSLFGANLGGIYVNQGQLLTYFFTSPATNVQTSSVFRDPSSWYHFVIAIDTTQSTAANRIKIYVNSQIQPLINTIYPAQNADLGVNSTNAHTISTTYTPELFNGYMTEVNFIDGQALTPSSFGETNATTGQWQPKRYTGTYGTNGFYLNFSDNSGTTATTLGKDYSGNGNNWTPNNFSVSAGAGNDSMIDVPTNWADGGNGRGNYCTLNPLPVTSGNVVLTNGNLDYSGTYQVTTYALAGSTIGVSSGKWYWEVTIGSTLGPNLGIGVFRTTNPVYSTFISGTDGGIGFYNGVANRIYYWDGSSQTYTSYTIASCTTGDVVSIALDLDNGGIYYAKNGTWGASGNPATQTNPALTGLSGNYAAGICIGAAGTSTATLNFGQRPFAYTPPSGFKALNTQNLPTPTIAKGNTQFNPVLYTGNGSTQSVTGLAFTPDLVWIKQRNQTRNHNLYDAVRGVLKVLQANVTDAEVNYANSLTSFNSDGFSLGNAADPNTNAGTYVAWAWKANGTGVTNTAGSITSTVSANPTAGFSVVTYTGTGANATVGHGLGVAPRMVIVKSRTQGTTGYTGNWAVWHTAIANTEYLLLNTTDAKATGANYWNSTTPTSSVFSIGTAGLVNTNTHNFVAYCFAAIPGYSAFGSYTGNGSADGPFVYTGFRPAYVLIKMSSSTGNWIALDSKRLGYNVDNNPLYPNLADAEATTDLIDILSNGFKIRSIDASVNTSSGTYIYAAFAESPFKYANAR